MLKREQIPLLLAMSMLSTASFAVTEPTQQSKHIVVAPQCLVKNVHTAYQTLSKTSAFALIEVNDVGLEQLMEAKHLSTKTPCGGFMDVTANWQEYTSTEVSPKANNFLSQFVKPRIALAKREHAYKIQYENQVNELIKQMVPDNMWKSLNIITNAHNPEGTPDFPDRYANSDNGVAAANWFKDQIEAIAKETNHDDVSVELIDTGRSYSQPSVVVKFGTSAEPGIVIGGHMDTLRSSKYSGNKPGADDDGTGSVTVLEVARTILSSGMHFKKPIYFMWYAAEEEGLVGSGYVVRAFKNRGTPIQAVLHFDMTGYLNQNDSTIWLMNDHVNMNLTHYLANLVTTYVKRPVKYTTCGYACSDHASWDQYGYASSMPFETAMGQDNPAIHTSNDTMDKISLAHMTDYAKLGVAFAVEMAEPIA